MADGGGWDDLFAAAAGDSQAPDNYMYSAEASVISGRPADPSSVPGKRSRREDDLPHDVDTRRSDVKRRNNKKSKKKHRAKTPRYRHGGSGSGSSGSSGKQKELLSHVLAGRMDISAQATRIWPLFLQPGGSLVHNGGNANTTSCSQYHGAYDAETLGFKHKKKGFKCTNCGKSPLEHKLELHLEESEANDNVSCCRHVDAFVMNRNIRACAANALALQRKSIDVGGSGNRDKVGAAAVGRYARVAKQFASAALSDFPAVASMVSSGEAAILQDKFESLSQFVDRWYRNRHNDPSADRQFEEMVRVIIASDALYYRLYYLQIIGELPILEISDDTSSTAGSGRLAYIPHPTTYFLVDYLCWDSIAGERYVNKYLKEQLEKGPDVAVKSTLEYYVKEDQGSQSTKHRHPLFLLRNSRIMETYLYFSGSGWLYSSTTKRDFIRAAEASSKHASESASRLQGNNTFYAKHESPAPTLLVEWRDSCRDFLCNLYAYATVSPESIAFIRSNPVCRVSGIIEPGAGTGYVASLLQIAGIDVDPYDIAPPTTKLGDAMNEYHGRTPSFTCVGTGEVAKLKGKLRASFTKIGSIPALLLCYPPPQSSMAYDALANYITVGGETVVHIGEWQGLTGSSNFEKLLVSRFHCGYRQRCLTWGTDASEVTIWQASGANSLPDAERILIPCSNCKKRPAARRCRYVRLLGYCSGQCYDEHADVRATHYSCNMVPHVLSQMSSFEDEVYTSSVLDGT